MNSDESQLSPVDNDLSLLRNESKLSDGSPSDSQASPHHFLARLTRVRPQHTVWQWTKSGLILLELSESSAQGQQEILADRIERIGRALKAEELAELLSVSRITIFKHAAAGRIPSFRIGTSVRFDPKLVAAWLRRQ